MNIKNEKNGYDNHRIKQKRRIQYIRTIFTSLMHLIFILLEKIYEYMNN